MLASAAPLPDLNVNMRLMQSWHAQVDYLMNGLVMLKEHVDDTEDLINIELDNRSAADLSGLEAYNFTSSKGHELTGQDSASRQSDFLPEHVK